MLAWRLLFPLASQLPGICWHTDTISSPCLSPGNPFRAVAEASRSATALGPARSYFLVTSQATPTCRPLLPPVLLLPRTGGPSNPGTELGPTSTHLSLSAAPCLTSLEWKCWSDATPLPCASGREPVKVNPRLGPVPREQDETKHVRDSHQHPWCCSASPNIRPQDNSLALPTPV